MDAVSKRLSPGDAAVARDQGRQRHRAAFAGRCRGGGGHQGGGGEGRDSDGADRRIGPPRALRTKARLGLHKIAGSCRSTTCRRRSAGARTRAVAQALSQRSITLIKDDRNQVPLRVPREASVLYLSVLDYPSGWRIAAPSRTFLPELRKRWPGVTAIELSDRSTTEEIELVRASAARYDAIVASVFVRAASASGRMDLAPPLVRSCCSDLARSDGEHAEAVHHGVLRQSRTCRWACRRCRRCC